MQRIVAQWIKELNGYVPNELANRMEESLELFPDTVFALTAAWARFICDCHGIQGPRREWLTGKTVFFDAAPVSGLLKLQAEVFPQYIRAITLKDSRLTLEANQLFRTRVDLYLRLLLLDGKTINPDFAWIFRANGCSTMPDATSPIGVLDPTAVFVSEMKETPPLENSQRDEDNDDDDDDDDDDESPATFGAVLEFEQEISTRQICEIQATVTCSPSLSRALRHTRRTGSVEEIQALRRSVVEALKNCEIQVGRTTRVPVEGFFAREEGVISFCVEYSDLSDGDWLDDGDSGNEIPGSLNFTGYVDQNAVEDALNDIM